MIVSYDAIASVYDADMGASMTLPDISYYIDIASTFDGPVLELGCGTGRVMTGLRAAGIDAYGVDISGPMLEQARARLGNTAPLMRMDMRKLGLHARFVLALLPYSLPTYLQDNEDWDCLVDGLRSALVPRGKVLVDAFVPQPINGNGGWMRDYARNVNSNCLVRHRRIEVIGPDRNRIERRYRMRGAFGGRTLCTSEEIRTYTPEQLVSVAERHIGAVHRIDFDYGTCSNETGARFCSVLAEMR